MPIECADLAVTVKKERYTSGVTPYPPLPLLVRRLPPLGVRPDQITRESYG